MKRSMLCLALCVASVAAVAQVQPSNPAGTRDPYSQGARSDSRFDPYTQGANQPTRQDLAPAPPTQGTMGTRAPDPYVDGARGAYPVGAEYPAPHLGSRIGTRSEFLDGA